MAYAKIVSHQPNGDACYVTLDIDEDPSKELAVSTLKDLEQLTAIGPYHHGKESLQTMEERKREYVKALLHRISITPESNLKSLQEFFKVLCSLEKQVRKSYSEIINLSRNDFLKMMLFDGVFIVELFLKSAREVKRDEDDPIFNTNWLYASLVRDMILLENQLPLFVLDKLFNKIKSNFPGQYENQSLTRLALRFIKPLIPNDQLLLRKTSKFIGSKHLLDLTYNVLLDEVKYSPSMAIPRENLLPSVTGLQRAGVKFKKGHEETSFLDIKFIKGVLEIPPLRIEDHFEVLLRNLIAWEQCCITEDCPCIFTSYAFLMDSLINTTSDVELLCCRDIITNLLGDDKNVSSLFNNLCKEVTLVKFCYSDICHPIKDYCKNRWHVWLPTFVRNFFYS
ncbi:PREDICTED: UPF0481 protein At3g47200-like isoform X1 [Nelumbo nucifera]|uniref:UPF0481 protein At3g47200-like isoform X1 n=2 Tax=Nelumbo nucifera TaxID=4432 RepID=A0A1U7Z4M9_NELNU|nr:PREDICTED: UPF0481 protein At3g47200-like isoform X1 [Nelumbo nucifera]